MAFTGVTPQGEEVKESEFGRRDCRGSLRPRELCPRLALLCVRGPAGRMRNGGGLMPRIGRSFVWVLFPALCPPES